MHNGFRIASRSKRVRPSQLLLQFPIVVNLAIKADPNSSIFVAKGLLAGTEVDNAQAPMTQRGTRSDIDAVFVQSAMLQDTGHIADDILRNRSAVEVHETRNSAHAVSHP